MHEKEDIETTRMWDGGTVRWRAGLGVEPRASLGMPEQMPAGVDFKDGI